MIQWIWRSRIRNDQDINIYIPSVRMRNLLNSWIEMSLCYQQKEAVQEIDLPKLFHKRPIYKGFRGFSLKRKRVKKGKGKNKKKQKNRKFV